MSSHRDELDHDYAGPMQEAWENGLGDFREDGGLGLPLKFDSQGLPILGDYVFGMPDTPKNIYQC
jgi:peroxin-5